MLRLSLSYPSNVPLTQTMLSGASRLTIDDRVTLSEEGVIPAISSGGPERSEFGAGVSVWANAWSVGDVDFLRSGSTIEGDIRTAGSILRQDNVVVRGTTTEGAALSLSELSWDVEWPSVAPVGFAHGADATNRPLDPGAFGAVSIHPRATVTLKTGTYTFESLVVEPEAHLRIDTEGGPVQIYVKHELRLNAGLEFMQDEHEQVLFGYFGSAPAVFGRALHAAVIAPNSAVELRRPSDNAPHKGAFFGREVHVFSDSNVLFEPLDLSFLCDGASPTALPVNAPNARQGNFICPAEEHASRRGMSTGCYEATLGDDFVSTTDAGSELFRVLYSGAGNDVVLNDFANSAVLAGEGDDVLCALAKGDSMVNGGPGDDTLRSAGQNVQVLPGAGMDTVQIIEGHATIQINHECEVVAGERYELLGGTAELSAPLTRDELEALGVSISPKIKVVPGPRNACYSSCSGAPVCSSGYECVGEGEDTACVERNPSSQATIPIDERYSGLSPKLQDQLQDYVDSIERDTHEGVAPLELRKLSHFLVPELIASISRDSAADRAAEIYALGSLYSDASLAAMKEIALRRAPEGVDRGDHLNDGEDWYQGQLHAVLWIHAAATSLREGGSYVEDLYDVAINGDDFTQEAAVEALLAIGPASVVKARLASELAAEDRYMLDLSFE